MSVYQKYIYHLLAPQRALVVMMMLINIFPATFFRFSLIPRHGGAYPRPLTSISKDWPSLMESLEMRKARFPKLTYGGKEKFENKKIRAGFCAKLKRKCQPLPYPGRHCDTQKGELEVREGRGLGGCQMQPRIAEDHGHVTLKLSIFCVVLTFFNFQNNKIYQMF